ncbi:MAG: ATP-binding protein [Fimbriimonadaceae bacterium]
MDTNSRLLSAVQLATRRLVSSGSFDTILADVLAICVEAVGAQGGTIYLHDAAKQTLKFRHVLPIEVAEKLPFTEIPDDSGVAGQAFGTRQTQFGTAVKDENRQKIESATGVFAQSMITVPLMMESEEPIGVVQLVNKLQGDFDENDARVLNTIAAVSTMAYLNSRLMEENSRASSLLGMGKVSHDIANLAASLFANISYSQMTLDGMKDDLGGNETAEMYVESMDSMLGDLDTSVNRIVRYARLISDLSAGGSLKPEMKVAALGETIAGSAAYLESEGRKNAVALRYSIQEDAPATAHDEMFVFRIVQNLVGNAIKAVKETIPIDWQDKLDEDETAVYGEVLIRYVFEDGRHLIDVKDSGPGMSPEVAERILSGNARSYWDKGGGSGWGTKIVLELAGTHEGEVTIQSEMGKGSTFRVSLPHHPTL